MNPSDKEMPPSTPTNPSTSTATEVTFDIEPSSSKHNPSNEPSQRPRRRNEERHHASISLPIPPDQHEYDSRETRDRYRKASGGPPHQHQHQHHRKTSECMHIHPSKVGSMSSSRRSYSRGAFFGDIPENIGSYSYLSSLGQGVQGGRHPSHESLDSDNFDRQNDDQGLGESSVECEACDDLEREGLGGQSKSYMSRISISMNRSVHPYTGETTFWGFSRKQWFLLFIFSVADLLAGVVYSLQAPFYPEEAERKGAKPTEYGLVFGVFELAMFIVSPIYGKYMSKLGPRNVFNVGIFITGTCCVLFGLLDRIEDKWTFISLSFAIRTVEAIGNAGFATATFTIIAMEFPESVATTFASLETFFGLGLIVGPTLGGGLYQLGGYTLPFVVTGGLIFTVALLVAIFMPRSVQISDLDSKSSAGYGILTILKIPGVLLATSAIVVGAISIGFLSSSLEPHIRQFNLSPLTTGLVFVINGGVYALTAPGWGWLCDRIQQTKYITLVGAFCLTIGFALVGPVPFFPYETILWVTCVGLFIQGLGVGATFVSSFILALRHSIAAGLPDNVATYSVVSGLWSSVLALGLFVGPSVAGVLYDSVGFRWGSMFVVGGGLILIFLIILFILCNGKSEAAYFLALSSRSSSSSSTSSGETEPLLQSKDDLVPEAVLSAGGCDNATLGQHPIKVQRQAYGATGSSTTS